MDGFPTKEDLIDQESRLVFKDFGLEDSYQLGRMLYDAGRERGETYAIRVKLGDVVAFQALMPGTGPENVRWMDRKAATVERTGHCSLWGFLDKEEGGRTTELLKDDGRFALFGGAFPLLANEGQVGVAVVSGLPHLEDHRRLTGVLERFLAERR